MPLVLPASLSRLVSALLADTRSDPALIALAITLPDPAYIAALEPMLDVEGIMRRARSFFPLAAGTPARFRRRDPA